RSIDPRVITTIDPQTVARVRPVLDPMSLDPLRRAAFETRQAQRRFDVPPAIAQRINTPVVASAVPVAPMNRKDLARALRVEHVRSQMQTRAQAMAAGQLQQLQQAAVRRQQQAQREATRQQAIINRQQPRVMAQPNAQGERAGNRGQRAQQNNPRAQPEMRRLPPPQAQPRPQPQPRVTRQEPPRAQPQPQRLPPQAKPQSQPRVERPQVQA